MVEAARRSAFWAPRLEGVPTSEVLAALPPLTREDVFENIEEMLDPTIDRAAVKWVTSGGSAGRQLGVWLEKDVSIRDWAHVIDAWGGSGTSSRILESSSAACAWVRRPGPRWSTSRCATSCICPSSTWMMLTPQ